MQMSISQNISSGYPSGFIMSSCCTGCLSMLQPWGRKSMIMPSTMAGGSYCLHETWRQIHPPWSSFMQIHQEKRQPKSTVMCTSFNGCQGKCPVMWRWRTISTRKSWILSRNASGASGILHCQRRNQVDTPPAPPGVIPRPTIASRTMLTITGLKI